MKTQRKPKTKLITQVEKACIQIPGFQSLYQDLDDLVHLSGRSKSTLQNYARKLAQLSLHFEKLPQNIDEKEINQYLASLARESKTPSLSDFKFTVYSLRLCYRMLGVTEKLIHLPSIRKTDKLPAVLNHEECKTLFQISKLLKHRILFCFIYSAGLRVREANRLKLSDIDTGRMMIHIRQSKNNKDRYVPLSPLMLKNLRKYIKDCRPIEYLFNGREPGAPLSTTAMRRALHEAVIKCKFQKRITLHTLRHSYATHLLEFGMDIVTIKELLGHVRIETTLVYLHVAIPNRTNIFSPFDRLYRKK